MDITKLSAKGLSYAELGRKYHMDSGRQKRYRGVSKAVPESR